MTSGPIPLLYVITDSGVGGSEKVLLTLLKNLNRELVRPVGVLVLKGKREMATEWEACGVPVEALGMRSFPTPTMFWNARHFLNATRPRIVHAFLYHAVQTMRILTICRPSFRLIGSPRVNYRFLPKPALWLDRLIKSRDTLALCESRATAFFLTEALHYHQEKIAVVSNGVDRETYQFNAEARMSLRREWGIADADILVGSAGRFHPQKGYDVLIRAAQQLTDGPSGLKFVLAGKGPEEKTLKKLAESQSSRFLFLREREDIPQFLSALDIYVQSSRYEGMPNALLEAMSVGCACLATAVDGTLDLAEDGKNMRLVKPEDPSALADAIRFLAENPDQRKLLADQAKMTAQNFSVDKMVKGFEQVYLEALKNPSD